jgi:hypothetical protein
MTEGEKNLYKRLYISLEDFRHAFECANFILKKGWHFLPWEKRGSIYLQQSAFTSWLIVSYSRPFTCSKGLPNFPKRLLAYDEAENKMHEKILDFRHQVYAHSDGARYQIDPIRIAGQASAVIGVPFFKLTAEEIKRLQKMIKKTTTAIQSELEKLMPCDVAHAE